MSTRQFSTLNATVRPTSDQVSNNEDTIQIVAFSLPLLATWSVVVSSLNH
jgi:hypothetical protein